MGTLRRGQRHRHAVHSFGCEPGKVPDMSHLFAEVIGDLGVGQCLAFLVERCQVILHSGPMLICLDALPDDLRERVSSLSWLKEGLSRPTISTDSMVLAVSKQVSAEDMKAQSKAARTMLPQTGDRTSCITIGKA